MSLGGGSIEGGGDRPLQKALRNETEGGGVWGGESPPQGWDLGRGCAPGQEIFVKFTLNSLILHHFVRITTV